MCARAPSHAVLMASMDGVPNRSVIKSNYKPISIWHQDVRNYFCLTKNSFKLLAYSQITRIQSCPIQCSLIFYFIHKLGIWENVKVHLLNWTLRLEENAAPQQLSEDAAHRPDVDGVWVVPAPHEDLRSPVILCHNFLSHVPSLVRLLHSGQAKIADLDDS